MTDISERFATLSAGFTSRATAVPASAWDNPAPCEGWVARDVVGHLVGWLPAFFLDGWGLERPSIPSVDADPAAAWSVLSAALQAALDDPAVATREQDSPAGRMSFEQAIGMICLGDLLVHTWDLARATGIDETLDVAEVHGLLSGMAQADEAMRQSGHYGPKVEVPENADEQTRLIAFTGRRP